MGGHGRFAALLAAVLALVLAVLPAPAASGASEAAPIRILLVGDSITHGSSGDFTWRYRLARHLDSVEADFDFVGPESGLFNLHGDEPSRDYVDPGFDQDHAARWGASASHSPWPVGGLVETFQPDVIIALIGVNDLVWLGLTPAELEDVMRSWVSSARRAKPDVAFVLGRLTATNFAGVADYNDRLPAMAASLHEPGSPVLVAYSDAEFADGHDTWDPAHPNARGEVKIAAAMADALAELGLGTPYPRPLPSVPLGPRFAPALSAVPGDEAATLTWGEAPGALAEFVWWRDVTAGGAWTRTPDPVDGRAWYVDQLVNWHTYEFVLQPVKGSWPAEQDIRSNVARVTPVPRAPGVVEGVVVEPHDYGVSLSWSPAEEATGYRVWSRNVAADGGWETDDQVLATTAADVPALVAGDEYAFRVQATNDGTWGDPSADVTATPTGPVPLAPSELRVAIAADGEAGVSWGAVSNATEYHLFRRDVTIGGRWTRVETELPITAREFRVPGLRTHHRYAFAVQPWNMHVAGAASGPVSARVPRPGLVRLRRAWSPRRDVVRVTSAPVTGADHYRVLTVPRRSCGPRPALDRYELRPARYRMPRARLSVRAPALWVRVVAVRDGVWGDQRPLVTRCVPVR